MSIEYGTKDGAVLWIRNPFTGNVTYFNNIHRKPHDYRHLTNRQQSAPTVSAPPSTYDLRADMHPGVAPPDGSRPGAWAIRVVRNIAPRIPEACTGGRNESHVIIEDARHFLPAAEGRAGAFRNAAPTR